MSVGVGIALAGLFVAVALYGGLCAGARAMGLALEKAAYLMAADDLMKRVNLRAGTDDGWTAPAIGDSN